MASFCTNCAAPLETGTKFCGACGTVAEAPTTSPESIASPRSSPPTTNRGRRYPALRVIAFVLKIGAVLTALGGMIFGVSAASLADFAPPYARIGAAGTASFAIGWTIFFFGLLYALFLWASAEMIHVMIDIEENTRRSSGLH